MYSNDNSVFAAEHAAYAWRSRWISLSRRARYLRVAALMITLFGLSRLVLPFRGAVRSFVGGWMDCGVALRTIFRDSVYVCHQYAMGRLYESLFLLFIVTLLLFASDIRRKLRFLGVVTVGASLALLLLPARSAPGFNPCRPAIFYLVARDPLFPSSIAPSVDIACNAALTSHVFLTAGVAGAGLVILATDAERRRRRSKRLEARGEMP